MTLQPVCFSEGENMSSVENTYSREYRSAASAQQRRTDPRKAVRDAIDEELRPAQRRSGKPSGMVSSARR